MTTMVAVRCASEQTRCGRTKDTLKHSRISIEYLRLSSELLELGLVCQHSKRGVQRLLL